MKKLLFIFFLSFIAQNVCGQYLKKSKKPEYGVKITIGKITTPNDTTYVGQPFEHILHKVVYVGSSAVKNIGVFGQQKFGWLYVRSELGYTLFTQRYEVISHVQVANQQKYAEDEFQNIDFQVMAGLTKAGVRFGTGPVAHIAVKNSSSLDFISGFESRTRSITYGFTTGIGYDVGNVHFDARYEIGFRDIGSHLFYINRYARSEKKAHVISFTLGVSF